MKFSVPLMTAIVGLVGFTAGCGGDAAVANRPRTYPVTGLVTYKGSPVADATVTFTPQQQQGPGAVAKTGADGRYALTTFDQGDGAAAGGYYVTLTKYDVPPEPPTVSQDSPDYVPPPINPKPTPPPKSLIPAKYADLTTAKLTADVKEGENSFDFPLAD